MAFQWGNIAQVFKSTDHHLDFQANGFVVQPFLDAAQLAAIWKLYREIHPSDQADFYTTTFNKEPAHRKAVHDAILEIVKPSIQRLFEYHKVYFCSFITKSPGPKSELILHQDMSLVDESKYNGINIWCPIVDLTAENGAIQVLPKSHRIYPTYRGSSLPDIYDGVENAVKARMESLYLKAGTAVIFDQSIMHYSPPNLSDAVRPVINCFVTHAEAKLVIAWADRQNHPGQVELFAEPETFMFDYQQFGQDIFARPRLGESLGWTTYDFPSLTEDKLDQLYGPLPKPAVKRPWWAIFKRNSAKSNP